MGNKLGRRRQVVDDKYTRPQGLYEHRDVDHKKLRKLILDSKLAPCYPGDDESAVDLEECPICFLYYPSLNRSRCCCKGICTECFLQMKTPNSARPTQCPFCKTSSYAVEFRGVKSKEEKGIEQLEEQRVIEAKIRMRKQEIQEDETRMQKRQNTSSTSQTTTVQADLELHSVPSFRSVDAAEIVPSPECASMIGQPHRRRHDRDNEFDLDLEDLMVMEAIWLSIQEKGRQGHGNTYADDAEQVPGESSSSPSGGLACAIASLAERQQMSIVDSENNTGNNDPTFSDPFMQNNNNNAATGWGPSPASSSDAGDYGDLPSFMPFLPPPPPPLPPLLPPLPSVYMNNMNNVVPESFEEQMMMAMAVSLADARSFASLPWR